MGILDDLLNSLSLDAPVRSLLVGAHWTVVVVVIAPTSPTMFATRTDISGRMRALHHKSARKLAELARSTELLEASIGVAAINSLLEIDDSLAAQLNASEVLMSRERGKNVALVGHFPFIKNFVPGSCESSATSAGRRFPSAAGSDSSGRCCRHHKQFPDQPYSGWIAIPMFFRGDSYASWTNHPTLANLIQSRSNYYFWCDCSGRGSSSAYCWTRCVFSSS
jgi:hypothetical protein